MSNTKLEMCLCEIWHFCCQILKLPKMFPYLLTSTVLCKSFPLWRFVPSQMEKLTEITIVQLHEYAMTTNQETTDHFCAKCLSQCFYGHFQSSFVISWLQSNPVPPTPQKPTPNPLLVRIPALDRFRRAAVVILALLFYSALNHSFRGSFAQMWKMSARSPTSNAELCVTLQPPIFCL